ncbi:MAG: helicase-related protein [Candidatus Shikimatogenerans sp. Ttur]|uniref:DNA 3'-5' helicase n=1 Tax=Candidatus Shikimatogenerans sp. Ttur TaxID=3158569 RepID=A0AAU7ZYN6_9FLAO
MKKLSPPGIIYCFTKKKVNNLTKKLVKNKIKVLKYHSNLQIKKRNYNQKKFLKNNKYIIICTIAFGMGINKSNIRFIIHYNIPKTIEDYFQETGRAGRDNKKSICILLYNNKDIIYIKKILLYYKNFFILRKFIKVIEYIYTSISRRKYLLNYFNENINEYNIKKYGIDDNIKYLQKYIKINKLLIFIKNKKKIKINNLFIIFKKKQYNYKYIINILIIKKILLLYKKKYIIFNYKKKKILNINYYIPYNHNNNFKNKKKCNLKLLFFLYNIRKNISKKIKYEEEYILNNYTLQYIAYNPPLNKKQFFKLKGIHILQIKKWGNFFLKKIKLFKNFFL